MEKIISTKCLHPFLKIYIFLVGLADCLYFDLTDMCYMLSKETASWNDARKACQKTPGAKGDLATIADQETLDFFKRDLKLFSATWIGGEKISGE